MDRDSPWNVNKAEPRTARLTISVCQYQATHRSLPPTPALVDDVLLTNASETVHKYCMQNDTPSPCSVKLPKETSAPNHCARRARKTAVCRSRFLPTLKIRRAHSRGLTSSKPPIRRGRLELQMMQRRNRACHSTLLVRRLFESSSSTTMHLDDHHLSLTSSARRSWDRNWRDLQQPQSHASVT